MARSDYLRVAAKSGGTAICTLLTVLISAPGAAKIAAAVTGAAGLLVTSRVRAYRSTKRYKKLQHPFAVVGADLMAGGVMVAFVDIVKNRRRPGKGHRDAMVAIGESFEKGGEFERMADGFGAWRRYLGCLMWSTASHWVPYFCAWAFPTAMALTAMVAAANVAFGIAHGRPIHFLLIVSVAATTSASASIAHYCKRPSPHQISMVATGLTLGWLTWYLWVNDVELQSVDPRVGPVVGGAFSLALLVWQRFARRDPNSRGPGCRIAAAVTAICGAVLMGLNIYERVQIQQLGGEQLTSLWPLVLVFAATLAAACPSSWGVGSRSTAVLGDQALHREHEPKPLNEAS